MTREITTNENDHSIVIPDNVEREPGIISIENLVKKPHFNTYMGLQNSAKAVDISILADIKLKSNK